MRPEHWNRSDAGTYMSGMAEIVCPECSYRVNVVRTGPNSAKPEHDLNQFERLCRVGAFRYLTATGCPRLDEKYLAASRRGEF